MSRLSHSEIHMVHRIGWLRAAVLGANDGLVSTASLVVGVAAAGSGKPEILIAGLDRDLAEQVALQLTERDALGSHARDELGISETVTARPIQAALVSALTFAVGAVVPLIVVLLAPETSIALFVAASTIVGLVVLGGLGASAGGAGIVRGAARVTLWAALAMAAMAAVGALFGVTVG